MDVSSKLNLVVDREVEVSVETKPRLEETSMFFQEIGEKQFKCLCCSEIFTEGKYVKKYTDDVHRDLRPFRCPACEYRCNTKGGLNNHIRNIEGCRVSII
jgi:Zn finger protein HypA/HybF involved in hydrogenase expression